MCLKVKDCMWRVGQWGNWLIICAGIISWRVFGVVCEFIIKYMLLQESRYQDGGSCFSFRCNLMS